MYKHAARSNTVQNILFAGSPQRPIIGVSVLVNPQILFEDRSMLQPPAPGMHFRSNQYRPLATPEIRTYTVSCFDLVDLALYEQVKAEHAAAKLKPAPVQHKTGIMVRRGLHAEKYAAMRSAAAPRVQLAA